MPSLLKRAAYDLVSMRDGLAGWKAGRREFRALAASDPRAVADHALGRLRAILMHAAHVPYYRDAWKAVGFQPSPHTTFDDLRRLPLVTKTDMRERKQDMVSSRVPAADLQLDYTGGTTGTHTSFYRDRACTVARHGRQWGILEACGYRPGDRRGLIWGAHDDLPEAGAKGFKQRLRHFASAEEILWCTVMSESQFREYHARLLRFRPTVIYGYPNAIEEFARFIGKEALAPIRVRRVLSMAEKLQSHQRSLFAETFGAETFDLYASREHGVSAFECARHDCYHVDAGSVVVELLRDGRPVAPGESGEIVITDLLNYGMPLIRHATADFGTAAMGPCSCGSPFPAFSALDGRVTDTLYRSDGSTIAGVMLVDLFFDDPVILQTQFVQHDVASLDVYTVLAPGAAPADLTRTVTEEVARMVGSGLRIRVHQVPHIPRNPRSGKYQEVICRVSA
jgi:phenylacetate-CoA ligase